MLGFFEEKLTRLKVKRGTCPDPGASCYIQVWDLSQNRLREVLFLPNVAKMRLDEYTRV